MFKRFTEGARQVVVLAQEEARILKHNYIGTEHILLGLLRQEEGLGAGVLESFDITVERVRAQVVRIVGVGEEVTSGQIPFTPRAEKVLELAPREALSLGSSYIGSEHILLGLLRENEGVAARILLDFDPDDLDLRDEVIRVLSGAPPRRHHARAVDRDELQSQHPGASSEIRSARMRLKRDLATGAADPIELVLHPPSEIVTAKVIDLLLAVPRWGRVRTNKVLKNARISPTKTFGGLSDRQRLELVHWLRRPPQSPGDTTGP